MPEMLDRGVALQACVEEADLHKQCTAGPGRLLL